MTSGGGSGTSGGSPLRSYAIVAAMVTAFGLVNALSLSDEMVRSGHSLPRWVPFALEGTSNLAVLVMSPLVAWAVRRAPPGEAGWRALLAVHLPASVAFSLGHVALMVALRHGVWAVAGRSFHFDLADEWFYEYRKDLLGYALVALVFWLGRRRARRAERPDETPAEAAAPDFVTLQDGVRPARVEAGAVLAAVACGNYVELVLAGGRRRLVRTTLARALEALAAHGFVRTHRSWIVCAGRVVEVDPTGTGDWLLRLDGGVEAPLSRRFPEALRRIRERQAAA